MNHTTYYQLSLWEQDDRIMREDFNDNNAKLDTAVKAANDRIDTKANAAALGAETTARENADTALGSRIDSEAQARQNADTAEATARANADTALGGRIDSEAAARAAAVAAIGANLGAHGHNCRIAWGSYTGTGTFGSTNPNTLTFDFYPVAVIIGSDSEARNVANPTVLLRDRRKGVCDCAGGSSSSSDPTLNLTWSDSGVSWYNTASQGYQNNRSGAAYYYVVLGYDKAAEEA